MSKRIPLVPTLVVGIGVAMLVGLGVWQLQRAGQKQALLDRYAGAERLPPISWPTMPLAQDQLPLFRHASGVCLRTVSRRAVAGANRLGETGYVHVVECVTGAEGPGMSVQLGWSKDPNARFEWSGGPVSGIIVPDRRTRIRLVAETAPAGLEPSKVPEVATASAVSPAGHRGYAATWFALALAAAVIYVLAVARHWRRDEP